ncbi:MAG: 16S rRNA (cytosine(967)-C(5))-methyltransferase RsmB [Oscillospiraceae bacterium]
MSITAREAALSALIAYRKHGARPDMILSGLSTEGKLDKRDMALAVNITDGVLQNVLLCDYYISAFSSVAVSKLEPAILDILRISVYQILFLTKIPDHAAVSEGVELSKKYSKHASGLVNAVLRRISENRNSLPEIRGSAEEKLSIRFSHPLWLVKRLSSEFGIHRCEKILVANNSPAPITIQVNTIKTTSDELLIKLKDSGICAVKHPFLPDAINVSGTGALDSLDTFKDGMFYVQDAAARLAVAAADPQPGMTVFDVCSAPGGKSFASAVAMNGKGEIHAFDIHENKIKQITDGARRLGIGIITAKSADARTLNKETAGLADIVIADVPCSGLGVIRKKPEIRFKSEEEISRLPQIQLDILRSASKLVKPGGVLLYSTCTILRGENQFVAESFLSETDDFFLESFSLPEPFGASDGMSVLLPDAADTDGFFICKMRRTK